MPDEPAAGGETGEQRELLARLRGVIEAKDAENAALRAELAAALDRERRLELRIAELERRLDVDSSNSGTPTSKEPIGAMIDHVLACLHGEVGNLIEPASALLALELTLEVHQRLTQPAS